MTAIGMAFMLGFRSKAPRTRPGSYSIDMTSPKSVARPLYRAVSIQHDQHACAAAREFAGKRFLVGKTPMLPLDDCDRSKCSCRYVHYDDRRESLVDRRDIINATTPEVEHRQTGARRRTDPRRL